MVTTLVKLRFLLLFNSLRKSTWQLVAAILGALYGLGALGLAIAGLVALSFAPIDLARTITTLAGAVLTVGWVLLPLVTAGIDQTVDPQRLATFPIPRDQLLVALLVSGVLGVPGIVTSLASIATAVTWWKFPLAAFAAIICAAIGVLICVAGSRMVTALASRVPSGRRSREARGALLIIPLILLGPILIGLGQLVRNFQSTLPDIATVVGWTPIAAIWAVPADVASGDFAAAGLKFLIGLATLVLVIVVWRAALSRALELPARASASSTPGTRGIGFFGVFPGTPWGAVAARALTYWLRDPRYAQSLIVVPLIPALIFFYVGATDATGLLNAVGPIVAVLLAMSIYTDVSYDNTAFALHLQKGVSGRDDRLGRVIALAVFAAPVSLLLTVGSVALTGTWHFLPGLLAITIGVLLTGFAVSSLISGAFIFPVPVPGESPFKSKPGGGFSLMLSTFASWAIMGVLILPELLLAVASFAGFAWAGWVALVVAIVLGSVLLALGVRFGGQILDARGPELLSKLQAQK